MFESRLVRFTFLVALLLPGCSPHAEEDQGEAPVERIGMPKLLPAPAAPVNSGLGHRIEAALKNIHERDLLTTNGFWTVFHGILGSGLDVTLLDPLTRQRVNAIGYICNGGELRGLEFLPTGDGLDVRTGPVFVGQGHQDQFIAEMAQWGMKLDRKFRVLGKEYTFADFVRHAQMRAQVTAKQELSWAVLIIAQYLGTNAAWTNRAGEKLTLEDVVRYELEQPIEDAACGGTHRLFGVTWAYHLHVQRGGKKVGVWNDVPSRIGKFKEAAKKYQNSDGTFSTRYLAGPGDAKDAQLRIGSTGHVLEWLALALSDEELRQPWVQDAASALSLMILDSAGRPIDGGALYHAAHGLHMYHARVFGPSSVTSSSLLMPPPPR